MSDKIKQLIEEKEHYRIELVHMSHQFNRVNEELKDFSSIVSHDLKGPLRNISTVLGWLEKDHSQDLDEEGKEYIGLLKEKAKHLYTIIDDVLTYSRLVNDSIEIGEVDLQTILKDIKASCTHISNLDLQINEMPTVTGNAILLRQVFQNLIENSTRYTDKPTIEISVSHTEEQDFWKFIIQDNGDGIDKKHHEKIFKIFQRFSTKSEGSGVGLAHVKKIVEISGGKVWVESSLGEGSKFHFTWPK